MSRFLARTSPLILPATLLAVLFLTTACSNTKAANADAPQAMPVKVQTAKAQKVDDTTDYVATLKSRDSAVVMPQVEGIITQIFVHSGGVAGLQSGDVFGGVVDFFSFRGLDFDRHGLRGGRFG